MIKTVIIKISGSQSSADAPEEENIIEFTTEGMLDKKEDMISLFYDESEMLGCEEARSMLCILGEKQVVLERTGDIVSKLVIEAGKRNNCYYETPYGNMTIGIHGDYIENSLTENGGKLKMKYTLDSDLRPISTNMLEITVNEV